MRILILQFAPMVAKGLINPALSRQKSNFLAHHLQLLNLDVKAPTLPHPQGIPVGSFTTGQKVILQSTSFRAFGSKPPSFLNPYIYTYPTGKNEGFQFELTKQTFLYILSYRFPKKAMTKDVKTTPSRRQTDYPSFLAYIPLGDNLHYSRGQHRTLGRVWLGRRQFHPIYPTSPARSFYQNKKIQKQQRQSTARHTLSITKERKGHLITTK